MCLRVTKRSHPWQFQEHRHLGRYLLSGAKWGGQSWRVKGWEGISARTGVTVGDTRPASPSHICFDSQQLYSILTWSSHKQPDDLQSFLGCSSWCAVPPTISYSTPFSYCTVVWRFPLSKSLHSPPQYHSVSKKQSLCFQSLSVGPPVCSASSGSQSP